MIFAGLGDWTATEDLEYDFHVSLKIGCSIEDFTMSESLIELEFV